MPKSSQLRGSADLIFGSFRLSIRRQELRNGDTLVALRPKPFSLLVYLARHPGRLLTQEELRKAIWPNTFVGETALRVHLQEVRRALGDLAGTPKFIETVPRRGYRFVAQIENALPGGGQADVTTSVLDAPSPESPIFVGRETELARLNEARSRALNGARQMVLLSGEAGIGKTTLLEAFIAQAVKHRVQVAYGQCVEHRGESEAYFPVFSVLQGLCNQPDGEQAYELLKVHAPSWLAQMPSLIDDETLAQLNRRIQGTTQVRMLREIADAIERFSAERLLLLAFEDLHWSDPSTLTLLDLLARRTTPARLMIIGTHRPPAMLAPDHPLRTLIGGLSAKYCDQIELGPFGSKQVMRYLELRLRPYLDGVGTALGKAARALQQRTEGTPLFVTMIVDSILSNSGKQQEGRVGSGTGSAALLESLASQSPSATQIALANTIAHQFAQLSRSEQDLLEISSVAGVEFSAAAVAAAAGIEVAEAEAICSSMANRMAFLQDAAGGEWPDGTVAERFRFRHGLYCEWLYGRLTAARKAALHQTIALREEAGYKERCAEIAAELAHHFSASGDFARGSQYHASAGQTALRRSAPREAVEHLGTALELLRRMPQGPDRDQNELSMLLALGAALQAARGYGAPEVEQTYQRARELCQQLGETPLLFAALLGVWSFATGRGKWRQSLELAERMLQLAQRTEEPLQIARASRAAAHSCLYLGQLDKARHFFEVAIGLCRKERSSPEESPFFSETEIMSCSTFSMNLELLGLSEEALEMAHRSLKVAEQGGNPHEVLYATAYVAAAYEFRREWDLAQGWCQRVVELAEQFGLAYFQAAGNYLLGAALASQGKTDEGIALIRSGIETTLGIGIEFGLGPMYLSLAEAWLIAGNPDDAAEAAERAFRFVKTKEERAFEPELLRLREARFCSSDSVDGAVRRLTLRRTLPCCFSGKRSDSPKLREHVSGNSAPLPAWRGCSARRKKPKRHANCSSTQLVSSKGAMTRVTCLTLALHWISCRWISPGGRRWRWVSS